jgi:hypothetical protein
MTAFDGLLLFGCWTQVEFGGICGITGVSSGILRDGAGVLRFRRRGSCALGGGVGSGWSVLSQVIDEFPFGCVVSGVEVFLGRRIERAEGLFAGGNLDITGIASFVDGQKIYLTNTGANLLQLLSLNGGSSAQYQFRLPSDFALVQNQTITLMYSEGIQKWLAI